MKKGELTEGVVTRLLFPNKATVTDAEGNTCAVKGALPGQRLSVFVKKVRKGKGEGIVREVLEPAPNEIPAQCPHADACGGCSYQTLCYEDQLALKEAQVKELLAPYIKDADGRDLWEPIHRSPSQFAYRNKMEFTFGDEVKDGPLSLGLHKKGGFYDIVPVKDCAIVDNDYHRILAATLEFFDRKKVPFYHRLCHTGYLRHLLVRKAVRTGEILVALVTTSQTAFPTGDSAAERAEDTPGRAFGAGMRSEEDVMLTEWKDCLLSLAYDGKMTGILHTVNDTLADVIQSDRTDVLYGQDYITEEILGLTFKISQFSFFQTNSLGAEVLYETARDFIGSLDTNPDGTPGQVLFDLYSGTGTIAQMMAPVAKKVIGVEIVEEAVEAARVNAGLNGLTNCEFIAGDVLKVLDDIAEKPDFIILDPPRDGIHPKALKKIIDYGVDRILYISCKPTSLARDLEMFTACGYRVARVTAVDMFPGTVHVETVVLLTRVN
ncbi:MAG: class I SAM-dependent RNA methyltransferase [Lachnospiraceae bacterium]|nr:class I SAM-dependent RNA methyltransferase [Lachnospiraceae bacterium]